MKPFGCVAVSFVTFILSQSSGLASENPQYQQDLAAAKTLVSHMSLAQKIGQMTLAKFFMLQRDNVNPNVIDWQRISQYHLGAMLVAGGEVPNGQGGVVAAMNSPEDYLTSTQKNWLEYTNQAKTHLPTVTLNGEVVQIPLLLGMDAVHGAQTLLGNTTFPQNIGLSMTHDPALLYSVEAWTAHDIKSAGFNWAYAPTVAVAHSPNWGRFSETLGSEYQDWIPRYAAAMVDGLQQEDANGTMHGVLATAKHFIGDGATFNGIDEGNDQNVTALNRFLTVNRAGYMGAVRQADAGSIMVSYSAINQDPMSFGPQQAGDLALLKHLRDGTLLAGDLASGADPYPFRGLLVSDYGAVDKAANQGLPATPEHTPYAQALAKAVNAGLDLFMIDSTSQDYHSIDDFQSILRTDVSSGLITQARIDEAVEHILVAKMEMGLLVYDNGKWMTKQPILTPEDKMQADRFEVATAIQAAEESFILLKNQHRVLPLDSNKLKYIVMIGESVVAAKDDQDPPQRHPEVYYNYDNLGAQNGGWTVAWQGIEGNAFWQGLNQVTSGASSILAGVKRLLPKAVIITPKFDLNITAADLAKSLRAKYPDMKADNTAIIGALAEIPTAEFMGDVANPACISGQTHEGCLYNRFGGTLNAYLPDDQPMTLDLDYNGFDYNVINAVKALAGSCTPLITILLSGRPRIINHALNRSEAFIAAWLPGTSGGQAIANALLGQYHFCEGHHVSGSDQCQPGSPNTLSVAWLQDMTSLKNYPQYLYPSKRDDAYLPYENALFDIGYGLSDE